jgi:hypothetical protein
MTDPEDPEDPTGEWARMDAHVARLRDTANTVEIAAELAKINNGYTRAVHGHPLSYGAPLELARRAATALVEIGLTVHDCTAPEGREARRRGGVCVMVGEYRDDDTGRQGVMVSWTCHDLLYHDWHRSSYGRDQQQYMNHVLWDLLVAAGFGVKALGDGTHPAVFLDPTNRLNRALLAQPWPPADPAQDDPS